MRCIACIAIFVFCGCADTNDSSHSSREQSFFKFQIALRQESREEEAEVNAGTFAVVSDHVFPVYVGEGPEEVTSIQKGVWVDMRWSRSEMLGDALWLYDLEYRIRNKMFYNGDGWWGDWSSAGGLGLSQDWQHIRTRIDLSGNEEGPLLYYRVRWLKQSPSIPDIDIAAFEHNT